MEWNRKRYRHLLAGFFLLMLFFTISSRIYDSVAVPKVTTACSQRKNVMNRISGNGTIRADATTFIEIFPGCKVESVKALQGSAVKTGEELLRYQMASLMEKREELNMETEKLLIDLEKERISSECYPNVTQEELALQEAAAASLELEQGKLDYDQAWADYHDHVDKLEQEYERKARLTEDELWSESRQQYSANRNSLNSARHSMEEAVKEAKRKAEDAEEELERLKGTGASDAEISQAEKELARALEDVTDARESKEQQLDSARDNLEFSDDMMNRIDSGITTSQIALKETYEEKRKQEEEILREAKVKAALLEKALAKANQAVANGKKSDAHTNLTNQQKNRLSLLTQKSIQIDIDRKRKELMEVEELIAGEGILTAKEDGVVVSQEVTPGKITTGEERLGLAFGALVLEGTFDKEEQELAAGDVLSIVLPGSDRRIEAQISNISLLGEEGTFRAELPELHTTIGAVTNYECRKQSEPYRQVIPIGGLRKDNRGYYVLVSQAVKTILGEEFRAVRKEVSLLYHGDMEAAVEGSLLPDEKIIIKSNKVVNEADRIRIVMEL